MGPREPEFYNQSHTPFSFRPFLSEGMQNPEGAFVHLGANGFTIYCGMIFDKPQMQKALDGTQVPWDGKCGPLQGPQCPACRWLENRLPNTPQLPVRNRTNPPNRHRRY